jgi:hypothetical protein
MLLINKGYTQGDVVSLKLSNSDELIAEFESETETSIKIRRPLALTMAQGGLGMMPWMILSSDEFFTLQKIHVMAMGLSKKDAAKQYTEGTTGIALT